MSLTSERCIFCVLYWSRVMKHPTQDAIYMVQVYLKMKCSFPKNSSKKHSESFSSITVTTLTFLNNKSSRKYTIRIWNFDSFFTNMICVNLIINWKKSQLNEKLKKIVNLMKNWKKFQRNQNRQKCQLNHKL